MAQLIMAEGATPSTPASGNASLFINTSGKLCVVDDAGNVFVLASLSAAQTFTGANTFTADQTLSSLARLVIGRNSLTIASGAITITGSAHQIDTEAGAASDDLDTINGGVDGQVLYLVTASGARDVVVRHLGGGTGNILTADGANITMGTTNSVLQLMLVGSFWREVRRQ